MVLVVAYSKRWCLSCDKANINQGIWVLTLIINCCCCCSLSRVQLFVTPLTAAPQASCPSLSPGVCSNSCPLWQWCHPTISSSVIPFSSCLPSFPALGSFPMSWLFSSGGQSTGASASASVLPMNSLGSFPLGMTSLISCSPRDSQESSPIPQFKSINSSALSFVYGSTLTSIHDYRKNQSFDMMGLYQQSNISAF